MIFDQKQLDYFKNIANDTFALMILKDYGQGSRDRLVHLTDNITNIYRYLHFSAFEYVFVYTALEPKNALDNQEDANPIKYSSCENLSPLTGNTIVIELKENGDLFVSTNYVLDVEKVRLSSIIYKYGKLTGSEEIFGKAEVKRLRPLPDTDSYFSIQTHKELESALEDYKTKVAMHSECSDLKKIWYDQNKIFFKPRPEHILRDSLTQFLKVRLRNTEVRPEQIVDKSHPVDIKITWLLVNKLALIEIKWLGKSLYKVGKSFKQIYTRTRALEGATQLVNYLDENLKQSPTRNTKGYLVVFDARRWGCNSNTLTISQANGLKYINEEIKFDPEYHKTRSDFSQPFRFFMQPIYLNS